jgi:hypothetical protein
MTWFRIEAWSETLRGSEALRASLRSSVRSEALAYVTDVLSGQLTTDEEV